MSEKNNVVIISGKTGEGKTTSFEAIIMKNICVDDGLISDVGELRYPKNEDKTCSK